VKIVDAPFAKRPFLYTSIPQDGAEVVNMVCDRVRAELLAESVSRTSHSSGNLFSMKESKSPRKDVVVHE